MSSQKYRKLVTNLPSMASVVNSFHSPDVQLEVYKLLIEELKEATEEAASGSSRKSAPAAQNGEPRPELKHALVDGDSIHVDDDLDG